MKHIFLIFCCLFVCQTSLKAECTKEQGLVDWILGEYTMHCNGFSYRVRNNDETVDVLVRAGMVASCGLIIYAIWDYGRQGKRIRNQPSIKYNLIKSVFYPKYLWNKNVIFKPRLIINKFQGVGVKLYWRF